MSLVALPSGVCYVPNTNPSLTLPQIALRVPSRLDCQVGLTISGFARTARHRTVPYTPSFGHAASRECEGIRYRLTICCRQCALRNRWDPAGPGSKLIEETRDHQQADCKNQDATYPLQTR